MKKIFITILFFTSLSVFAVEKVVSNKTVNSVAEKELKVDLTKIAGSQIVGRNPKKDITVRFVVLDNGLGTMFFPRYSAYITFSHTTEMRWFKTAYKVGDFVKYPKFSRKSGGIYVAKGPIFLSSLSLNLGNMQVKQGSIAMNLIQTFIDERKIESKLNQDEHSHKYFFSKAKRRITLLK